MRIRPRNLLPAGAMVVAGAALARRSVGQEGDPILTFPRATGRKVNGPWSMRSQRRSG
jgi:hypothetical protein